MSDGKVGGEGLECAKIGSQTYSSNHDGGDVVSILHSASISVCSFSVCSFCFQLT